MLCFFMQYEVFYKINSKRRGVIIFHFLITEKILFLNNERLCVSTTEPFVFTQAEYVR